MQKKDRERPGEKEREMGVTMKWREQREGERQTSGRDIVAQKLHYSNV